MKRLKELLYVNNFNLFFHTIITRHYVLIYSVNHFYDRM